MFDRRFVIITNNSLRHFAVEPIGKLAYGRHITFERLVDMGLSNLA